MTLTRLTCSLALREPYPVLPSRFTSLNPHGFLVVSAQRLHNRLVKNMNSGARYLVHSSALPFTCLWASYLPSLCLGFPNCKMKIQTANHIDLWELNGLMDHKEGWVLKNWCFWTVVLEKTLESPLDSKERKPVHLKGNQPWIFIGSADAEAEAPVLWPPDAKN